MNKSKNENCNKTPTNHLIIFYGPPCAGKTTLSKIVANKLGVKRISIDSIRNSLKGKNNIFTDETNDIVFTEFLKKINRELNKNRSIICEGLFISKKRKAKLTSIPSNKFNIIYVTASENVLLRRLQDRRSDRSNSGHELMYNMTNDELINLYKKSVPPKYKHIIIDTGRYSKAESVERILNILDSDTFTRKTIMDVF